MLSAQALRLVVVLSLSSLMLSACAGARRKPSKAPAKATASVKKPAEKLADPAPAPEPEKETFPTACAGSAEPCTPPERFVEKLCQTQRTDAALVLFAKSSPWTRGYLTRDTEAWNASGGGTSRGKLIFDEEVIVLRKREASGMIVGQGSNFDVLRWDGSCATLANEELTMKKPPRAKTPAIGWRNLSGPTRDALMADSKIAALYDKRRKECKGVTSGDVSMACVKAEAALDSGIVAFVREGGAIPIPVLP